MYAEELAGRLQARGHDVGVVTPASTVTTWWRRRSAWPYRLDQFASATAVEASRVPRHRPRQRGGVAHGASMPSIVPARRRPLATPSRACRRCRCASRRRRAVAHVHTIHDYWLVCQRASMTNREGGRARRRASRAAPSPPSTGGSCRATARRSCCACRRPPRASTAHPRDPRADPCAAAARRRRAPREQRRPPGADAGLRLPRSARAPQGRAHARSTPSSGSRPGSGAPAHRRPRLGRRRGGRSGRRLTIEYVGFVDADAKAAFLESLDCLVVPSEWREPGALVVSEAKAELLPVIGARIGGIPEVVPPSCAELLFAPGDAADLRPCRWRPFCRRARALRRVTPGAGGGWDAHVGAVEAGLPRRGEARRRASASVSAGSSRPAASRRARAAPAPATRPPSGETNSADSFDRAA